MDTTEFAKWVSILALAVLVVACAPRAAAGEIGFVEDYALAPDRAAALGKLVPGSAEHRYYQILTLLHQDKVDEAAALLNAWPIGDPLRERVYRRYLAAWFKKNPTEAVDRLRAIISPDLGHEARVPQEHKYPTALPADFLDVAAWRKDALERLIVGERTVLTPAGMDALPAETLLAALDRMAAEAKQGKVSDDYAATVLSQFLNTLERPDYPRLAELVARRLNDPRMKTSFGQQPIHLNLTRAQLEELGRLCPDLANNMAWINARLARMVPSGDANAAEDDGAWRAAWDERWTFLESLPPVANRLRSVALAERLQRDRKRGVLDAARFAVYLQIPRSAPYANHEWLAKRVAALPGQGNAYLGEGGDREWVKDYFLDLFTNGADWKAYQAWVNERQLRRWYAEAMLTSGKGDPAEWYRLYNDPAAVQRLKDRVDLDFAPENPERFGPDDPVKLGVHVKNVASLTVKVFEVNTLNWYRRHPQPITTDIDLDGLVANDTRVVEYKESPFARVLRTFDFPALNRPGVYVVEVIGGGRASRAVIRRGALRLDERMTAAGHVFAVLDEDGRAVKDAAVWVGNRRHAAGADGEVLVPYGTTPGRTPAVVEAGGFADLAFFNHREERYELSAGLHVDREMLLAGRPAKLFIRPLLTVNGHPAPLAALTDVELRIDTLVRRPDAGTVATPEVDREDVGAMPGATQTVRDLKLSETGETVHEFMTPKDLLNLTVGLSAKVRNLSLQRDDALSVSRRFVLNAIDLTDRFESLHFSRAADGYALDVLGKTGEPRSGRPVLLRFHHPEFAEPKTRLLQSDAAGRIVLGALGGIELVQARLDDGRESAGLSDAGFQAWTIEHDEAALPATAHGVKGGVVRLPYAGQRAARDRFVATLFELRGGLPSRDVSDAVAVKDGFLEIAGLAPGDYRLHVKENGGRSVALRIADAPAAGGYARSRARILELPDGDPLQIRSVAADANGLVAILANAGPETRVHIFARRFVPAVDHESWDAFERLGRILRTQPMALSLSRPESVYLGGRDIGDEYRYILERRNQPCYAGSLLDRPGLLLQPWALRDTATTSQSSREGEAVVRKAMPVAAASAPAVQAENARGRSALKMRSVDARSPGEPGELWMYSNLDWLAASSVAVANLKPAADGTVRIPRSDLGDRLDVIVLATDPDNAVARRVALSGAPSAPRDLRLRDGLDPESHIVRRKQIVPLVPGKAFTVNNLLTDRAETYTSLADVHRLFLSLTNDADWAEFAFLLRWPTLKDAEKDDLYAKYACHELNFFLYKKDRPFFDRVVGPYLANKKDKAFLDHYLTGGDLSPWLASDRFYRLNAFERLLLADRAPTPAEAAAIRRRVREDYALVPPDREAWSRRFDVALQRGALDAGDGEDDGNALNRVRRQKMLNVPLELEEDKTGRLSLTAGYSDLALKDREAAPLIPSPALPSAPPASLVFPAPADQRRSVRGMEQRSITPGSGGLPEGSASNAEALRFQVDAVDGGRLAIPALGDTPYVGRLFQKSSGMRMAGDLDRRAEVRAHFRQVDAAKEWAESNYWRERAIVSSPEKVAPNAFWRDYADYADAGAKSLFVSVNFAECARSFADMAFALAVLDLPFSAPKHESKTDGLKFTLVPGGPGVAFREAIAGAVPAGAGAPSLLAAQHYFRVDDRYRLDDDGERREKFVVGEFLVNVPYGVKVVVTNPSTEPRKVSALLQIPVGALPLANGFETRVCDRSLGAYETETFEYAFYFPRPGTARHYPAHLESDGALAAYVAASSFAVVEHPSAVDEKSWEYLSQRGTPEACLAYLRTENLGRVDLADIAWRLRDPAFFRAVLPILRERRAYNHVLWGYALLHRPGTPGYDEQALREFLAHDPFADTVGPYLSTPLLVVDPVARGTYRHLEYAPLVNARAHALGTRRQITNDALFEQYTRFLDLLAHKPALDDEDRLAVAYYLFLQDRMDEGAAFLRAAKRDAVAERLQHDYLSAWLAMRSGDLAAARSLAERNAAHPAARWRKLFAQLADHLAQAEGRLPNVADPDSREQAMDRLAASAPSLDFDLEGRSVALRYQNAATATVNYYRMDLELLFSRNPFAQEFSDRFGLVAPNRTETIRLPEGGAHRFEIPEDLRRDNMLVEVTIGSVKRSKPYLASAFTVRTIEQYGQIRVNRTGDGKPLANVYVKVYRRGPDGQTAFYKDGYTDIRGVFDYATLSAGGLDDTVRFALLVLSDDAGAALVEAEPPRR